ncbi:hypothetical protein ACP4OV_026146 [Aristida adscensionis]
MVDGAQWFVEGDLSDFVAVDDALARAELELLKLLRATDHIALNRAASSTGGSSDRAASSTSRAHDAGGSSDDPLAVALRVAAYLRSGARSTERTNVSVKRPRSVSAERRGSPSVRGRSPVSAGRRLPTSAEGSRYASPDSASTERSDCRSASTERLPVSPGGGGSASLDRRFASTERSLHRRSASTEGLPVSPGGSGSASLDRRFASTERSLHRRSASTEGLPVSPGGSGSASLDRRFASTERSLHRRSASTEGLPVSPGGSGSASLDRRSASTERLPAPASLDSYFLDRPAGRLVPPEPAQRLLEAGRLLRKTKVVVAQELGGRMKKLAKALLRDKEDAGVLRESMESIRTDMVKFWNSPISFDDIIG